MNRTRLFGATLAGVALGITTSAAASRYAFGEREIFLSLGNVTAINALLDETGLSIEQTVTDDAAVLDVYVDAEDLPDDLSLRLNLVSLQDTGLAMTGLAGEAYVIEPSYERDSATGEIVDYGGFVLLSGLR